MSESVAIETSADKTMNDMKSGSLNNQMSTNNVINDSKSQTVANNMNKDDVTSTTPGKRRKRANEIADSSLVLETPPGVDGNRRQTRSQTRGTPAPIVSPSPAKKPALDKSNANASNGTANKGRRGRPPKSATASDSEEKMDQAEAKKEEKKEQTDKVDGIVESKPAAVEKSDESKSSSVKDEKTSVDNKLVKSNEETKTEAETIAPKDAQEKITASAAVVVPAPQTETVPEKIVSETKKEETKTSATTVNSTTVNAEVVNNHEK